MSRVPLFGARYGRPKWCRQYPTVYRTLEAFDSEKWPKIRVFWPFCPFGGLWANVNDGPGFASKLLMRRLFRAFIYSYRKASIGSSREARLAGPALARRATMTSMRTTRLSVSGSPALV